ncbi:MAG: hypothetical protein QXY40_02610 [Candidatus Methanomethylicia archaeon]
MPRRPKTRKRKSGYMYFIADGISSRMNIEEIVKVVFSKGESYRRAAYIILEEVKRLAAMSGRTTPTYNITSDEMSEFIKRKFGRRRRSLAYKVLFEFLIPLGMMKYSPDEKRYFLSREFALALKRIGDSYLRWLETA